MQLFVEVIRNGWYILVFAHKNGYIVQLHVFRKQPLHFFAHSRQGLFRIVLFFIGLQEGDFDIAFVFRLGRLLGYIGIGAFQGDALFLQLFQMQCVQIVYCGGKQAVVEVDDIRFAPAVCLQGFHAHREREGELDTAFAV